MLKGRKTINVAIANAHNELYAFYTGKGDLLKKVLRPMGKGGRPYRPRPLNPPLLIVSTQYAAAVNAVNLRMLPECCVCSHQSIHTANNLCVRILRFPHFNSLFAHIKYSSNMATRFNVQLNDVTSPRILWRCIIIPVLRVFVICHACVE